MAVFSLLLLKEYRLQVLFNSSLFLIMNEPEFKLLDVWKSPIIPEGVDEPTRQKIIRHHSSVSKKPFSVEECTGQMPMLWWEEAIVCIVSLLFFGSLLYGPFILLFLLYWNLKLGLSVLAVSVSIVLLRTQFMQSACFSSIATLILRYFSYRGSWTTFMPTGKPLILAAPPHGLFPVGNMLAIMALPRFGGFYVRGAAASAVLNFPIAGNMMKLIGAIDASKEIVSQHLRNGEVVGISTGGIAEIFETDVGIGNTGVGKECIILKSRGGMCKLALQTGAAIVPCYLFGNSQAFSVWYDKFGIMQWLSRKLRISLVLFRGRWGLPIPYRTPIFGVCDAPIYVEKTENPSNEAIENLLNELQVRVRDLFETYKSSYGWEHVTLVIK